MSAQSLLYRLSILSLLTLLAACSGGDASTSTGTGTDPNDPSLNVADNTDDTNDNISGSFEGSMVFSNGDSDPITVNLDGEGNIIFESNMTGQRTTGTISNSMFTSSGTVNFNFNDQICAGPTIYTGEIISAELIEGTFTSEPVCETADGGTQVLNLDGSFSANLDTI